MRPSRSPDRVVLKAHEIPKPTSAATTRSAGVERTPPRSGIAWVDEGTCCCGKGRSPVALQAKLRREGPGLWAERNEELRIGEPGDALEQQADRVADAVVSRGATDDPRVTAANFAASASGPVASPRVLQTLQHSGAPLDPGTRSFMESRLDADFGAVRIHTDAAAAASARSIDALAYTSGDHVVFDSGMYAPSSTAGRRLLAHELTHVVQQRAGAVGIQRQPANPAKKADEEAAIKAEQAILDHAAYKKLLGESKLRVKRILALVRKKPYGTAKGQRGYYLVKLEVALTTKFEGKETGKASYDCSDTAEKENRKEVEDALNHEAKWWNGLWADVEEKKVADGKNKVVRWAANNGMWKQFYVDRSDPRNIRVLMKVKLKGKPAEIAMIKKLEDAIERSAKTKGYTLDLEFTDKSALDVFEFKTNFCEWANAGNWASGPVTLSHELHHALGLGDRYDYIEAHAANPQMNVAMRLVWFEEQVNKQTSARDPYGKMDQSSNPMLSEDICAVAWKDEPDRKKCIAARKDLDPAGIPGI
jgi:hypothetical protein